MVNYFPSLDSRDIREHLEECFAALKPISQYMKGNLPEDLFLNSVLALLHPPREGA